MWSPSDPIGERKNEGSTKIYAYFPFSIMNVMCWIGKVVLISWNINKIVFTNSPAPVIVFAVGLTSEWFWAVIRTITVSGSHAVPLKSVLGILHHVKSRFWNTRFWLLISESCANLLLTFQFDNFPAATEILEIRRMSYACAFCFVLDCKVVLGPWARGKQNSFLRYGYGFLLKRKILC